MYDPTRNPLHCYLSICFLILTVAPSYCQSGLEAAKGPVPAMAEVQVAVSPNECRVGTVVNVTFEIKNTGSVPFYIPMVVEDTGSLGGFDVQVTAPDGAKALRTVMAGDPVPGWPRDILSEIKERYIILRPGDFYGATRPLNAFIPLSPGTFKIVARRTPPRLSTEERNKLRTSLKLPVLLDVLESPPTYLKVLK
jgi:hypothetical protein